MENFLFGISALATSMRITIIALINHPLIWGFGIGFFVSTVIHMFIITDVPHAIPTMITRSSEHSFKKHAPKNEKGEYMVSFEAFQKEHLRVRIAFYLALLAFLFVIGISVLRS